MSTYQRPDDAENRSGNSGFTRFRAILHIGMGGLYLVLAFVVIYGQHFGQVPLSKGVAIGLGALLTLYGAFRLWRGFADLRMMKRH